MRPRLRHTGTCRIYREPGPRQQADSGRRTSRDVAGFLMGNFAQRGTLACAPRFAAVLARALYDNTRVGDASHPPLPQRWTVTTDVAGRRGGFSGNFVRRGTL